jgi:hypothetical protein
MNGGRMSVIVSLVVVSAAVIGACLVALWRRGGTGERGAVERGAAGQEFARGLGAVSDSGQNIGSSGS